MKSGLLLSQKWAGGNAPLGTLLPVRYFSCTGTEILEPLLLFKSTDLAAGHAQRIGHLRR